MTITENGSGRPCAYFISSRTDKQTLMQFFNSVKEQTGPTACEVFMSDDDITFYSAWTEVMGCPQKWLLCTWHVLHSWNTNLQKVKETEGREQVKQMLHTLLSCTDGEEFNRLVDTFLDHETVDPEPCQGLKDFVRYFGQYYARRPEKGAFCHRTYVGLTTNNHLESMHRTLKKYYLHREHNKRIDKLI